MALTRAALATVTSGLCDVRARFFLLILILGGVLSLASLASANPLTIAGRKMWTPWRVVTFEPCYFRLDCSLQEHFLFVNCQKKSKKNKASEEAQSVAGKTAEVSVQTEMEIENKEPKQLTEVDIVKRLTGKMLDEVKFMHVHARSRT